MSHDDAPEMVHYRLLGAGYQAAYLRGDRDALIDMLDRQVRYLETVPQGLKMWFSPSSGLWVDAGTVLALARQRRERFNHSNAAGDCWPWRG